MSTTSSSSSSTGTTFPLRLRKPDGTVSMLTVSPGTSIPELYNYVLHNLSTIVPGGLGSTSIPIPIKLLAGFPPKEILIPDEAASTGTMNLTIETFLRPNEVLTLQPRYPQPSSETNTLLTDSVSSPSRIRTTTMMINNPSSSTETTVNPASSASRKRNRDGISSDDNSNNVPTREIHNRQSKDKAKETIQQDIRAQEQIRKEQKKQQLQQLEQNKHTTSTPRQGTTTRTPTSEGKNRKRVVMPGEGHRLGSEGTDDTDKNVEENVSTIVADSPFSVFMATASVASTSTSTASPSRNLLSQLGNASSPSGSVPSSTENNRLTGILTSIPNRSILTSSSSSSSSSSSAVPSITVPAIRQRRRTVRMGGSTESIGELLARSGRGSGLSIHGDTTLEYLRSVSQIALQKQYEVTTANERLTAVQLGLYEITPVLTSRTLRTGAPALLKVRFKPSNQGGWREETVDNVPAIVLPTLLRTLANETTDTREAVKPHVMSQAAPRTFWAVIRFGGAMIRQEVPLPAMDQSTPQGYPVDPLECIRALVPTGVDWSFLTVRTKRLTEKGQKIEEEKRLKVQRKTTKKDIGGNTAAVVVDLSNEVSDSDSNDNVPMGESDGLINSSTTTTESTETVPKVEPHHMILDSLALCHAALNSSSLSLPVMHEDQRCIDAICASAGMVENVELCTSIHTAKSSKNSPFDEEFATNEAILFTDIVRKLETLCRPNTENDSSSSSGSVPRTLNTNGNCTDMFNFQQSIVIQDYMKTIRTWSNPQSTLLLSVSVWQPLETLLSHSSSKNDEIEIQTYICDNCGKAREVSSTEANFDELNEQDRWTCTASNIPRIIQRGACTAPDDDLCRIVESEEIALALSICGIPNIEALASCLVRDEEEVFYTGIEGALSTVFVQSIGRTAPTTEVSLSSSSSFSSTPVTVENSITLSDTDPPLRYREISENCRMTLSSVPNSVIHRSLSSSDTSETTLHASLSLNRWYNCLRDRLLGTLTAYTSIPSTVLRMEEQRSFGSYRPQLLLYRQRSYQLLLGMSLLILFPYNSSSSSSSSLSSELSSSSSSSQSTVTTMGQHYVQCFTTHKYLLHALLRHPLGYLACSQLANYFLGFARADAMDEYLARIFDYSTWVPTIDDEIVALNLLRKKIPKEDDNNSSTITTESDNNFGIRRYYTHQLSRGTDEETIEEIHDKVVEKLRSVLDKVGLRTIADIASMDSLVLFSALRDAQLTTMDNTNEIAPVTTSGNNSTSTVPCIVTLTDIIYWQRSCRNWMSKEPWLAELLTI